MKLSIKLGVLSASNILLAFGMQWYILMSIGIGEQTDAFFAGLTIPQLVTTVISNSLMHVLVPLLSGETQEKSNHDTWAFLTLVSTLFISLALVLCLTAQWWIPLTVPGFSEAAQQLTIDLTRIQLIGMIFNAINGVQWASYHARQKFLWVEFVPILTSLLGLALLVWALPRYGIIAAAWIASLRFALQFLLLLPGLGRPVRPKLTSPRIKQAWKKIKPLLLGTTYYKTDNLINRFLLSGANEGSLSLFYLANQIYEAIVYVFNKAMIVPLLPTLSIVYKEGEFKAFKKIFYRRLFQTLVLGLMAFSCLFFFGQLALTLILGHGYINSDNIYQLWLIMIWLTGSMIGGMATMVVIQAFYAFGDTLVPTKTNIITYTLHIPTKIIVYNVFGIIGLALEISMYQVINFCILLTLIRKKMAITLETSVDRPQTL